MMAAARSALGRPIRVLELRSVRGTGGGPEKTILLGAALAPPGRIAVTVCYIRDVRDHVFDVRSRTAAAVDYTEVLERHSFDPGIWRQLRDVIRSRDIDIIHSHDYKTDLLALLLARTQRIRPLATAHGWIRNTPRERFYCWADVRLLARFPSVIAVSEEIRTEIIAAGAPPQRVHRIPNGVDHEMYRPDAAVRGRIRRELRFSDECFVIGSVGRLASEKRFDLLLRAAAPLGAESAVVLAGDGAERDALHALAQQLGMRDRVHLLGLRGDVPDLLQALDLFVQSSDTEGLPNAVLEAMATEVPVVATRVGGTPELIDDGVHGVLVPAGDAAHMRRAIMDVVEHRDAARGRALEARRRIEGELSFSARMNRVEAIYRDLMASKSVDVEVGR
jgi:glycosyltransferase involved in cell wall biosynthesis